MVLDVERIVRFMGRLHGQFKRDFIIGACAGHHVSLNQFMLVNSTAPSDHLSLHLAPLAASLWAVLQSSGSLAPGLISGFIAGYRA